MAIKTDLVNGRDLKVGHIYIPNGEPNTFCKITSVTTSKPGKHGSAKNIIGARNIINGKNINTTFKDTDEKITQVLDFNYVNKVIYSISGTELCTNLVTGEMLYLQSFGPDQTRVQAAFDENRLAGQGLVNDAGAPLCIKYTEMGDQQNTLIFWELLYIPKEELARNGINDYVSE